MQQSGTCIDQCKKDKSHQIAGTPRTTGGRDTIYYSPYIAVILSTEDANCAHKRRPIVLIMDAPQGDLCDVDCEFNVRSINFTIYADLRSNKLHYIAEIENTSRRPGCIATSDRARLSIWPHTHIHSFTLTHIHSHTLTHLTPNSHTLTNT